MERGGYIYILTNKNKTTLYVGVTSDLISRIAEHRNGTYAKSFTSKNNLNMLVYWEGFHNIEEAIDREKLIKGGSRKKKELLINSLNPQWEDLYNEILDF